MKYIIIATILFGFMATAEAKHACTEFDDTCPECNPMVVCEKAPKPTATGKYVCKKSGKPKKGGYGVYPKPAKKASVGKKKRIDPRLRNLKLKHKRQKVRAKQKARYKKKSDMYLQKNNRITTRKKVSTDASSAIEKEKELISRIKNVKYEITRCGRVKNFAISYFEKGEKQ